jgi:hypothetical protein
VTADLSDVVVGRVPRYGYNASAQAGWCSWGKSFNLSQLVEGYEQHGLPGMYRIDCVGCQELEKGGGKYPPDPGFAAGVVCDHRNCSACPNVYHMCNKTLGDATDWDEQTLALLNLARPYLISGALRGVFLGDELSAQGSGAAPHDPTALSFYDIERWVDLVRGFLDEGAAPRAAAGTKDDMVLYYTSSDYCMTWPYIPRNLTLFSMDDYHPSWMYELLHRRSNSCVASFLAVLSPSVRSLGTRPPRNASRADGHARRAARTRQAGCGSIQSTSGYSQWWARTRSCS